MSSLSHDDVFALRLELSDQYLDENVIIKELKLILLENGFNNEDSVNQFLVEFYQKFGFNIELETVQSININPIQPPSQSTQILNNFINSVYIQNNTPELNNYNNNISEILENLNQIINLVNNSVGPPPMDDVKVTLKDESRIKKYKLSENKEEKCSICMSSLEKENHVWELPCGHIFHQDCISKWLKEYNYKCPICRQETGESKFDV